MAVYLNTLSADYLEALRGKERHESIMVELLNYDEIAYASFTAQLSYDDKGSINCNDNNGVQRASTLTLIDTDGSIAKSLLNNVSAKIKLWYGLQANKDTYYFAQGVYFVKTIETKDKLVSLQLVDKYGLLNGELKAGAYMYALSVEPNQYKAIYVGNLIEDTLSMDAGNGRQIDPIKPNIWYNPILTADIITNAGGYISETFETLANLYGSRIYYDRDGVFNFEQIFDYGYPFRIMQKPAVYEFDSSNISDLTMSTDNDNCNTVIVSTDNTDGDNVTVIVQNTNAFSDFCVDKVGTRLYDGNGVTDGIYYIPLRNGSEKENSQACKDMGEYLLMQEAKRKCTMSFNTPVVPHLQVGDVVLVNGQRCVLQSLTIPLASGELMQVQALNVEQLPYEE